MHALSDIIALNERAAVKAAAPASPVSCSAVEKRDGSFILSRGNSGPRNETRFIAGPVATRFGRRLKACANVLERNALIASYF